MDATMHTDAAGADGERLSAVDASALKDAILAAIASSSLSPDLGSGPKAMAEDAIEAIRLIDKATAKAVSIPMEYEELRKRGKEPAEILAARAAVLKSFEAKAKANSWCIRALRKIRLALRLSGPQQ